MGLTVQHATPGLGVLPRDIETEACSGLVGVALGIAQAQAERGHRAVVLGWNPQPGPSAWTIGAVEAHATPGWTWANLGNYDFRVVAPLVVRASRLGPTDILHAYTDPHLLLARGVKKRLLHFQTPIPADPPATYTRLVNRADAVLCCGSFIKSQFLERVDYPPGRVYEVNNGIDLSRFDSADGRRFRDDWGIAPDTAVVLFTGALVPEKGLLYLLQAVAKLQNAHDFELVVAGNPELWLTPSAASSSGTNGYVKALMEAAAGLRVRWLGAVPQADMPSLYAAADICTCPSAWDDPFPLVACEAMAAGKPIVASRRGGLSQIVAHEETGLLVPSENVEALASGLDRLLSNRDLATHLGHQAKLRSRRFSWARIADELDVIYQELGCTLGMQTTPMHGSHAG